MKITQIKASDFLCLKEFSMTKLGKLNKLTGGNGVGKTAVLKAIQAALQGRGITSEVIKTGTKKSEIYLQIDSNIDVRRRVTPSGNSVEVVADGEPVNKPQTFLDSLLGSFLFNPVDFLLESPRKRREILLSAIPLRLNKDTLIAQLGSLGGLVKDSGVDWNEHGLTVLEQIKGSIYSRRKETNGEMTRLKKSIEQDRNELPDTVGAEKFADFDLVAKTNELSAAREAANQQQNDIKELDRLRSRDVEIQKEIAALQTERVQVRQDGKALAEKTQGFVAPDLKAMTDDIAAFTENQAAANTLKDIKRREDQLEGHQRQHEQLDALYKKLTDEIPQKLMAEADHKITGLEIDGDTIKVNDVSLDTLSTSEQVEFSLQIARQLAGKLKVICLDRFESLDADKKAAFVKAIKTNDPFEYFITEVTGGELKTEVTDEEQPAPNAEPSTLGAGF